MQWEILPHRGMRTGDIELVLNGERAGHREAMARQFGPSQSPRWPTEDQYYFGGASMFLRYDDADRLEQVMLLDGRVSIDGLELLKTTWPELEPALHARGYTLVPPRSYVDGQDCPELGVTITTRADLTYDDDEVGIEWVAIARPE